MLSPLERGDTTTEEIVVDEAQRREEKGIVESRLRPRGLVVPTHLFVLSKCVCLTLVLLIQVPKLLLCQGKALTVVISLPPLVAHKRL